MGNETFNSSIVWPDGWSGCSFNSFPCCSLCLPALPPLTAHYLCCALFIDALLQAKTVACLALPSLSLFACARSTDCLVCALFAWLRSLAGCCLPSCVYHSHTFPLCLLSSLALSARLRLLLALPTLSRAACSSAS